jgi:hypothetical protein
MVTIQISETLPYMVGTIEGTMLGGYGTNEIARPAIDVKRRVEIYRFLTSSAQREAWALSLGLLEHTEFSVPYNKNMFVTDYAVEYYKGENLYE